MTVGNVINRQLQTVEVKIYCKKVKNYENTLVGENGNAKIVPPRDIAEVARRKKSIYRTLDLVTEKIGIDPTDHIEGLLQEYKSEIELKARGVKFGEVEVIYKTREIAERMATRKLQSESRVLFPSYMGRRVARIRVGKKNGW